MLEQVLTRCLGKDRTCDKTEWEQVDIEEGLRKAGLKSLFPAEVSCVAMISLLCLLRMPARNAGQTSTLSVPLLPRSKEP
jgi:hypothetical protein